MGFISKEDVAQIRKNLKAKYPDFKFSVRGGNSSSLYVVVKSGPVDFKLDADERGYRQVNHYYVDENYQSSALCFLNGILDTIDEVNKPYITHECVDYGSYPSFYRNIHIGSWNQPYVQTELKAA